MLGSPAALGTMAFFEDFDNRRKARSKKDVADRETDTSNNAYKTKTNTHTHRLQPLSPTTQLLSTQRTTTHHCYHHATSPQRTTIIQHNHNAPTKTDHCGWLTRRTPLVLRDCFTASSEPLVMWKWQHWRRRTHMEANNFRAKTLVG